MSVFIIVTNVRKVLNKKNLCILFVDLEKAFHHLPRRFIWRAMRVVCATEWIVFLAKVIHENTKIKVRINNRFMDEFPANTSVHQGSILSLLRLIMVLGAFSFEFRTGYSWQLLYVGDLAIMS